MKYLPITLLLSLLMMAYWLIKDEKWFLNAKTKTINYFKNTWTWDRFCDLFSNMSEHIADDVEQY